MSSPIVPELLRLLEEATKRPREIRGSDDGAPEYEIVANGLIVGGFFEVASDGSREPIDQEADAALIVALAATLTELRRLLKEAEKAEEFCRAVYALEVPDADGCAWHNWQAATSKAKDAMHQNSPALLDAYEALRELVEAYDASAAALDVYAGDPNASLDGVRRAAYRERDAWKRAREIVAPTEPKETK